MIEERGIWWLYRIVEVLAMSNGVKENLITPVAKNTVPSTGPLIETGTTLHPQARRIFVDVGPIFLKRKFLKVVKVFSFFRYYLPLRRTRLSFE